MDDKNIPDADRTPEKKGAGKDGKPGGEPQWADSLRNMYDKVVDEPIPDSFKDLLAQFDDPGNDGGQSGGGQ